MFYRNYYIYELIDPRTDIPRYVGITATPTTACSKIELNS